MIYKVCFNCKFLVQAPSKLCHTCGHGRFIAHTLSQPQAKLKKTELPPQTTLNSAARVFFGIFSKLNTAKKSFFAS